MNERTDAIFGPIKEAYRHGNHAEARQILERLIKSEPVANAKKINWGNPPKFRMEELANAEKIDWMNLTEFTIRTADHGEEQFVLHHTNEQKL